ITVKSMTDLLKGFSPAKRLSLLQHIKELWPLFKEFGAQTISERLSMELYGSKKLSPKTRLGRANPNNASLDSGLTDMPKTKTKGGSQLDQLIRSFRLVAQSSNRASETHVLPELMLVEGVLMLDESVQPRSEVDPVQRTVRWSRKLGLLGEYEHGWLQVHPTGFSAIGAVLFCREANPVSFSKSDIVPVQAVPPKAVLNHLPRNQNVRRSFRKQGAAMPLAASDTDDEGGRVTHVDYYQMTYDKSIWPPDVERNRPIDPFDGGLMGFGSYITQQGLQIPTLTVPVLDQLRDHINNTYYRGETKLASFYRSTSEELPGYNYRLTVELDQAALIPFIADTGPDFSPINVSFEKTLGINLVLPFLFQSFHVEFDSWYETATGALYEYDPTMRAMKGNRHFIMGRWNASRQREGLRADVSRAMAAFAKPGLSNRQSAGLEPCSITKSLFEARAPHVDLLANLPGYDEQSVHNQSQTLIQNMMYWHMDDDQRERFTTQSKPTDLPPQLTTGLPTNLHRFFKETYAPAFIARSISQVSGHENKMTERERRKITYWSEEYTQINNMGSIYAMRQLYSNTLDLFFNSREGPNYWAQQLYDASTRTAAMRGLLRNPMQGGNNVINMRCNTMNALAPEQDRAQSFFKTIVAFAAEESISYPYADDDPENAYQWLSDALSDLVLKVLSNDPSITREVIAGLLKDLEEFEKQNGLNQQLSAEQRAANIVERSTILVREGSRWMTAIGKGLAKAFGGTRLFQWGSAGFDAAAEKVGNSVGGVDKLKGSFTITLTAFYIAEAVGSVIGIVQNWDILNDSQRAVVILETLRIATDAVGNTIDAWTRYKSGTSSGTQAALDMGALDQSTQRTMRQSGQALGDLADEISGRPHSMESNISDALRENGPTPNRDGRDRWNERVQDLPDNVSPGAKGKAKKFSMSGNWLNALDAALGVAVTVAMAFSLVNDWKNLTDVGKVLNTLSVIVQALTVLLDIVVLGGKIGLWVVSGTFAAAIPVIGAVLAVLGIVLMLVGLFVNLFSKPNPPPDPVQLFIDGTIRPMIAPWLDAPDPKLVYSSSPTSVNSGRTTTVTISMKNNTRTDVRLTRVQFTVYSGIDPICLFREDAFDLVEDTDNLKQLPGKVYSSPGSKTMSRLDTNAFNEYIACDLSVFGNLENPDTPMGDLLLKPSETFTAVWTGVANSRGNSTLEVFEVGSEDNTRATLPITRL
ncbi:MAG: hypothetical protein Q9163_006241, partial [Psora crenata]